MPSKHSPRMKRPPSPYSVSQSPRTRTQSQQRVWRSLSSTGEASSSNTFAEKSREIWLKSLRQGTDSRRSPVKGNHHLNTSLTSTSDYLKDEMGLPSSARKHKRSNSVDLTTRFSSPQHKSPEDMYDEIISLKKTMVVQKNEYDALKTKTRRLEEENRRKEKQIEQFLDPKASDESIRRLAESGSQSGSTVLTGLKRKILKLEKQNRDKDNELSAMKSDVKTTDIAEMKAAMEIYYQEVLRLRDVIASRDMESERLSSSLKSERDHVPSTVKTLRKNVVKLTTENHQLIDDNKKLRRDLDIVLNGDNQDGSDEDEGEIKYSALGRVELVTMVKKMKKSSSRRDEVEKNRQDEEFDKLKNIITHLKDEKNELKEEKNKLKDQNKSLENDLDKQTEKVSCLRNEIEVMKRHSEIEKEPSGRDSGEARRRRRSSQSHDERRHSVTSQPKARPRTSDRNKAASSIQKQWREHRERKMKDDHEIVALQSALRGHLTRSDQLNNPKRERSPVHHGETRKYEVISDSSDSDDDGVVYLQSAMRGDLERRANL